MNDKQEKYAFVEKKVGETPLEALERFRESPEGHALGLNDQTKLTYAGRLDPMAEGQLLVLIGDECKHKDKYLGLDKEYEVDILFGIETDSYDSLGLPRLIPAMGDGAVQALKELDYGKYAGKFIQEYPAFSSKSVAGKQLHEWARIGEVPEEMPTKKVEIYEIEKLSENIMWADTLLNMLKRRIERVRRKNDFRQNEIMEAWDLMLSESDAIFTVHRIRVKCSSGTYMRSLAHRIGKDVGTGAFALRINRTKICLVVE